MNAAIETAKTGAVADAKTYADGAFDTKGAAAAAQSAAEATAKGYTDDQLTSYTKTTDMNAAIETAKTGAVADAATDAAGKYQVKSSKMSIGGANGSWTDLTAVTGYSETGTHSLVLKGGKIQWEEVVNQ